jgi:hypothetical protein
MGDRSPEEKGQEQQQEEAITKPRIEPDWSVVPPFVDGESDNAKRNQRYTLPIIPQAEGKGAGYQQKGQGGKQGLKPNPTAVNSMYPLS